MLRNDDISIDAETVVLANALQRGHKRAANARIGEFRLSVITTESQEVNLSGLLKVLQSPGHNGRLLTRGLARL
jgi:hypothetical protein